MKGEPRLGNKMKAAIAELESLIQERYPEATFQVIRSPEYDESVHLLATVDLEDHEELIDIIMEPMLRMQIEEELPILVVPLRTPAFAEQLKRKEWERPHSVTDLPDVIRLV